MRIIKSILSWIFNPFTKIFETSNQEKSAKIFNRHPSLMVFFAAITTALIVLGIYFL